MTARAGARRTYSEKAASTLPAVRPESLGFPPSPLLRPSAESFSFTRVDILIQSVSTVPDPVQALVTYLTLYPTPLCPEVIFLTCI